MSVQAPPVGVLRAFGVEGLPQLLAGGQGGAWHAGHLVVKRDVGPCHAWLGEALAEVEPKDIRVAKPVRARTGRWSHDGWAASSWVEGTAPDQRSAAVWSGIIEAGRAFHRAVAHVPRPPCLHERQDSWALADGAAWGERIPQLAVPFIAVAQRLQHVQHPKGRAQLVHGDLTGNVLSAPGLPPAVIDLSPYWRPPGYAEGIVVADALCWHDAAPSLPSDIGVSVPAVARGLLFRIFTTSERVIRGEIVTDIDGEADRYSAAASAIGL